MKLTLNIACFGPDLHSSQKAEAAAYYPGIFRELTRLGHAVTFYEPDTGHAEQQASPGRTGLRFIAYAPVKEALDAHFDRIWEYDVIIKCEGIGALDAYLEDFLPRIAHEDQLLFFWDTDTPATLKRLKTNQAEGFLKMLPYYDAVLIDGGGQKMVNEYTRLGATQCLPVYPATDPDRHFPVSPGAEYACDLLFVGDRQPGKERGIRSFFMKAADLLPQRRFLLGGTGWQEYEMPPNIEKLGEVKPEDQQLLHSSARAVLQLSDDDTAPLGYFPGAAVFEAAAAGACIISDEWEGVDAFFEPDREILVAKDGRDVALALSGLTEERAGELGAMARQRVLKEHQYRHRALELEQFLLISSLVLKPRI